MPGPAPTPGNGQQGPDLVVLGSASRDVTDDDPRGWRLGGGVTYAALAAARLGIRTAALIGVDPDASDALELDLLRTAGVEIELAPLQHGPVFHNLETPAGRIQTCLDPGLPLRPRPLPGAWASAAVWFVAPVADETQEDWAEAVPATVALVVGWQGLLRELSAGRTVGRRPPGRSALIARADLVAISRHDVAPDLPDSALATLLRPGAQLLVTHGAEGGRVLSIGSSGEPGPQLEYEPAPSSDEVDATGAGDTFLAALVTALIERARVGDLAGLPLVGPADLAFAAAAASLAVEGPGLEAVPERSAVLARLAGAA